MAVQTEIWVRYIMNRLWKDNAFLANTFNDDQYVLGGKIVHIPQPGSKPTIIKNRSSYPGTAVQRTDTDITYTLDSYTSDPTQITEADKQEITYDKIGSVFGDHAGQLVETVADDMIIKWLTGLTINVAATGAATAGGLITGQTGTRKAMKAADLKTVAKKMNLQNIPKQDRYALIESNMLDQLMDDLAATQYRDFSKFYDAAANEVGVMGMLYGFKIMERSTVAVASAAGAVNPLGAAVQTDDNVLSFCWQKNSIARALGERKFFERKDDPLYYGDIYSALLRMGGRRRRSDDFGIITITAAP